MTVYVFTAVLNRIPDASGYDLLYNSGLTDCVPENREFAAVLHVTRKANSIGEAITSVASDVAKAGFLVVGIEDIDFDPTITSQIKALDKAGFYESQLEATNRTIERHRQLDALKELGLIEVDAEPEKPDPNVK